MNDKSDQAHPQTPPKYDKDASMTDPVLRCAACSKLILHSFIKKEGTCSNCGNRRVKNVLAMSGEEMEWCKQEDLDPDFLALFEPTSDT